VGLAVTDANASDTTAGDVFGADAPRRPRNGDVFECDVLHLDERGGGQARVGEYTIAFEGRSSGALPGARVRAVATGRKRSVVRARVDEVLVPSPHAVPPRCEHVRDCGGCRFQDLAYEHQLVELGRSARLRLAPLARFGCEPGAVIGAAEPWRYRNKMDFTFASRRWREENDDDRHPDFALGLHASGHHEKALDVRACHLQHTTGDAILTAARALALEHGLAPWNLARHEGFLRHLVVRRAVATDEWLVYVVTSNDVEPRFEAWWRGLIAAVPQITTLVHGPTARLSAVALGDEDHVLFGPGFVRERLGGVEFRVSARSFFQTNTAQAGRLLEVVRDFASVEREQGGVLWDLYCGAGLFALTLGAHFDHTLGIELVEAAVIDARANAERAGLSNVRFEAGDALDFLARAASASAAADASATASPLPRPDVAIVDPPRAGLHRDAVRALAAVGPPRLVYVSCNLDSAARDLVPLLDGSLGAPYGLERTALVDLFPHTPHLEGVFALVRS
jgi:23S rRNA (uracil1939-C5)-methyltransferase